MDEDMIDEAMPLEMMVEDGDDNTMRMAPLLVGNSKEEQAQILIEMLRAEELSDRITAAHQLTKIAGVIGFVRTRKELLPYLVESVDDDDEVLIALAEGLGKLVPFVGGNSFAHSLLPLLEMLLTTEENAVREKAITSTRTVVESFSDEIFNDEFVEMVIRLATKEWFTARMSSCFLLPFSLSRLHEHQKRKHVSLFAALCRDDMPLVRRVAAQNLGELVNRVAETSKERGLFEGGLITASILPLYIDLAGSAQDSIRLHMPANCMLFGAQVVPLMEKLDEPAKDNIHNIIKSRIIPLIISCANDSSWRVRWTTASKFSGIVEAFKNFAGAMEVLIPAFESLLRDTEAEVRTAATFNLSLVAGCGADIPALNDNADGLSISKSIPVAQRLVQSVASLIDDDNEHVRAALASVATDLAPLLGREEAISRLLPPLMDLLRDPSSEVRLNLISTLSSLNEVIGLDLLSQSLLSAILELAEDSKWRIRLVILRHIPLLAEQLGKNFVGDNLTPVCVRLLEDDISSIREAAARNLADLTSLFGSDWAFTHFLPAIEKILKDQSYLRRLTALKACAAVAMVMNSDIASQKMLPIVLEMSKDNVPNVRFNVAKALSSFGPKCANSMHSITQTLNKLVEDSDRDVRHFAKETLDSFGSNSS